jgi:antitoxin YefM
VPETACCGIFHIRVYRNQCLTTPTVERPAHAPLWSREAAESRTQCSRLLNPFTYGILIMTNILYRSNLMDVISYTAARANLAKTMEQVCEDHSPVIITRSKSQSVVMISLEDYEALQEAAYLLRAPKNAWRLLESVAELEQGGGQEKELLE